MEAGALAGFPMVDLVATLYDGGFHPVDSSNLAFTQAAKGAFKEAMRTCKPRLLEPIMKVDITVPEEYMGDVIGDVNSRRGLVEGMEERPGGMKFLKTTVPLANMFSYVSNLRS